MTGLVHEERLVGAIPDQSWQRAVDESEFSEPFGYDPDCRMMRVVPVIVLSDLIDRGELCFQDNLVDRTLFGTDFPFLTPDRWMKDWKGIVDDDELTRKIMWSNAAALLGLVDSAEPEAHDA